MKILLTGATGFTGGDVLRQALIDAEIDQVTVLTRRATGRTHPKLQEIVLRDFLDYSSVDLTGYDACIWCLGISQAQVSKEEYVRITFDYAVAAANAMFTASPGLRFCFLSARGADQTERTPVRFARIKGRTERALDELGGRVFHFRPAYIAPTARSGGLVYSGVQRRLRSVGLLPDVGRQTRRQPTHFGQPHHSPVAGGRGPAAAK